MTRSLSHHELLTATSS